MPLVNVEVTAEDIGAGVRKACDHCPIALAILRLVIPGTTVYVDGLDVEFDVAGGSLNYEILVLPIDARLFVTGFDENRPVYPFSFPLDIPDRFLATEATSCPE